MATLIKIDIKVLTRKEKIAIFQQMMQNCHIQNFAYFFILNYKFAKLRYDEAESMETDTFQKANMALTQA